MSRARSLQSRKPVRTGEPSAVRSARVREPWATRNIGKSKVIGLGHGFCAHRIRVGASLVAVFVEDSSGHPDNAGYMSSQYMH